MPTAKKAPAPKTVIKRTVAPAPAEPEGPLGTAGRYHVRMEVNGQVFEGNTDCISQAIGALKPDRLSTKVVFHFSRAGDPDSKVVSQFYMVPRARRLFASTLAMGLLEKAALMGLGDYHA